MTAFGELMQGLMAERGISLHGLAKIVKYDVGYLCKVKNGKKPPSPELAAQLDPALGANGRLIALIPPRGSRSTADQQPTGQAPRAAHTADGGWRLAAAVRNIRDNLREDAKLLHARSCQLALAADPLRAAMCRAQAIASENAAEHLNAALAGNQPRSSTPPSGGGADSHAAQGRHTPKQATAPLTPLRYP